MHTSHRRRRSAAPSAPSTPASSVEDRPSRDEALRAFGSAVPSASMRYTATTTDGHVVQVNSTAPESEARALLAQQVARVEAGLDVQDYRRFPARAPSLDRQLDEMAAASHPAIPPAAPTSLMDPNAMVTMMTMVAQAQQQMAQAQQQMAQAQQQAAHSQGHTPATLSPGPLLSQAITRYLDYMAHRPRSRPGTSEVENTLMMFLHLIGDGRTTDLTMRNIDAFIDALRRWPPSARKRMVYRHMHAPAILEKARQINDRTIDLRTQQSYIERVRAFFRWLETRREIEADLLKGVRLWRPQDNAGGHRLAFTEGHLHRIFQRAHVPRFTEPHMYWGPLLALFTGMRLTEVCQLYVADIDVTSPTPSITVSDMRDGQRLKTRSARRKVPIHPRLMELGLPAFVAQCKRWDRARVFPGLIWRGNGPGDVLTHWFNATHLRKTCGIGDKKRSFHSFRHTFATLADEADVPWSRIAKLLGHKSDDAPTATLFYFQPRPPEHAEDDLVAIRFPVFDYPAYEPAQFEPAFERARQREVRAERLDAAYEASR